MQAANHRCIAKTLVADLLHSSLETERLAIKGANQVIEQQQKQLDNRDRELEEERKKAGKAKRSAEELERRERPWLNGFR